MNRLVLIVLLMGMCLSLRGQDGTDTETRINPELGDVTAAEVGKTDYSLYPYLALGENWINLNGDDWTDLRQRFACLDDTIVSIVHIGDSHIQAEGSTSVTRRRLQQRFGAAGRGLVIPFRLAGTNQPVDYVITTDAECTTAKLMKQPWPVDMGFTGIAIAPKSQRYTLTVSMHDDAGIDDCFDYLKIFGHGHVPQILSATSKRDGRLMYTMEQRDDTLDVWFTEPTLDVTFDIESTGRYELYGIKLENSMMGLEYSAIGNNGATYSAYNAIPTLGNDLRALSPHLIIVSLGANEAFGTVTDETMYNNIDLLVRNLQTANPDAHILLTTPSECQRTTAKRRARRKTYAVNTNINRLRNVILRYGRDNHVATYDWYAVSGGDGSSYKWLTDKLLNTDRIHNTWKGYAVQGDLLYDAIINAIEK